MATKKELEEKKEHARLLYMNGEQQKIIAEKVGVSAVTINKWVEDGGWKEKRAASNITRPELVNKLLITINNLLEEVNKSENTDMIAGASDKLSKLAAVVEKLDKKANVVDAIEVFMAFSKWLQFRATFDEEVTSELLKIINKYQDLFVTEIVSSKISKYKFTNKAIYNNIKYSICYRSKFLFRFYCINSLK